MYTVSPQSFYAEALIPNVTVSEGGTLGSQSGLYKVMRVGPPRFYQCPYKERERDQILFSLPWENAARRWPSPGRQQPASGASTWHWTSQPPELWEIHVRCFSHPGSGVLLQQPKVPETLTERSPVWGPNTPVYSSDLCSDHKKYLTSMKKNF